MRVSGLLLCRWMGELRKPSSLDPTGWVALRPVSGAAATVFFLRQVLGLYVPTLECCHTALYPLMLTRNCRLSAHAEPLLGKQSPLL